MPLSPYGYAGFGTILYIGDGASPPNYTIIPNLSNMKIGGFKTQSTDVTTHTISTSGPSIVNQPWVQKIPTLLEGGQITADIEFAPEQPTHGAQAPNGMLYIYLNRQIRNWKITMPTSPPFNVIFTAFIDSFPLDFPVTGVIKTTVSMTVTSFVAFA
jgi:hypothetical protein